MSPTDHATKSASLRELAGVIVFTSAYTLGALVWILLSGNFEFLFYVAVMVVLVSVVYVVHQRVALPKSLIVCLSLWGALHMAGGLVPLPVSWDTGDTIKVLYNWHIAGPYFKYDQLVHAFGFGITTWLCWCGLQTLLSETNRAPRIGVLVLCVAAGMGFGALNEVIEFAITLMVTENNVGGYFNTGMDLVYNMLGAIFAALLIGWRNQAAR